MIDLQSTTSVAEDLYRVEIWSTDRHEWAREVNTRARSGRRGAVAVGPSARGWQQLALATLRLP